MTKNGSRNRTRRRSRSGRSRGGRRTNLVPRAVSGGVPSSLVRAVCAVTDPFCLHAVGAKWNSATSDIPSYTYTTRTIKTVTTGDTGWAYLVVVPNVSAKNHKQGTVDTSTTVTMPTMAQLTGSSGLDSTAQGSFAQKARIVSCGVRYWDIAPATSAGGQVIMQALDYHDYAGDSVDITDVNTMVPHAVFDRRAGGAWVARRGPVAMADQFLEIVADATTYPYTMENLILAVSGSPDTAVLAVEIVTHWEILPVRGRSSYSGASNAGRIARQVIEGLAAVQSTQTQAVMVSGKPSAVSAKLRNDAISIGKYVLREYGPKAIGAGAAYFGGPAAGALAGGAASYGLSLMDGPMEVD